MHNWRRVSSYSRSNVGESTSSECYRTQKRESWIITAIDYATGWPIAKALPRATEKAIADFIHDEIYMHYGAPKEIFTDGGKNLWGGVVQEYLKKIGTNHKGTSLYHPLTNDKVERTNDWMEFSKEYCPSSCTTNLRSYEISISTQFYSHVRYVLIKQSRRRHSIFSMIDSHISLANQIKRYPSTHHPLNLKKESNSYNLPVRKLSQRCTNESVWQKGSETVLSSHIR